MRRALLVLVALAAIFPGTAPAGARFAGVDTSAYPLLRATVVADGVPKLTENGRPVAGLETVNLGRSKSVVLAVDRSRSMAGPALEAAADAARSFVASKREADRIAVVGFGSRAVVLTGFSSATIDADAALRTLDVDRRQGTALYDAVVAAGAALSKEPARGRVLVLLTDGSDVSSEATLAGATRAARAAGVAIYAIAIASRDFSPAPLRQLVRATGGRYYAAASTVSLAAIYASIASELTRTWQLSYVTSARPGDRLRLAVAGATADATAPGPPIRLEAAGSRLPSQVFALGPLPVALAVAACIFAAAVLLLAAPRGDRLRRRLEPHLGARVRKRARGRAQERFATASMVMRATERAFGHLRVWHSLHRLLERADVPLRTVELVYAAAGSGLLLGLLCAVAGAPLLVTLLALAFGAAIPVLVVSVKARRRLAAIEEQLPDLLVTLAASLKAGHSFHQGIQAVVDEGLPPASTEFKRVLTDTRLGRSMDDALAEMGERVSSKNLTFVVTAVTIQRQVGGSLAGIFDMVADAVRQRQQFARKIRSLTAMGRASAYVLVGIPFFLLGAISLVNAEYMDPLYHTSTGHTLMVGGVVMIALGSLMLRKIVSFRG